MSYMRRHQLEIQSKCDRESELLNQLQAGIQLMEVRRDRSPQRIIDVKIREIPHVPNRIRPTASFKKQSNSFLELMHEKQSCLTSPKKKILFCSKHELIQ